MTYSKASQKAGWTTTTVDRLTGGINTQSRSDLLTPQQVIQISNLRIQRDMLIKDTGYRMFAAGGGQDNLDSIPQASIQFYKKNGTSELICVTKGTVYRYAMSADEWQYVKGNAGTTLADDYGASDTNLEVVDSTDFAPGQLVGIMLDDGHQWRTTIDSVPDGTHVVLDDALPGDASSGNEIIAAPSLHGSDDLACILITAPSDDWLIFTNGVDVVQRYDGTDCIPIPGLPASGNCVATSIALYNNALFLIGTIEGGTAYPQRVRRSEIGVLTTWSGGTSGYDDLLDTADYLIAAEPLGPYLVVYKERTIYRAQFVNAGGKYYAFDAVVKGEGLAAYQGIVDMGDFHVFIGNSNIYEYRGDFAIEPIADNVFYNLFSFDAGISTVNKRRAFAFFVEELNEIWFFFTSSGSMYPDLLYRYSVTEEAWVFRQFSNLFVGYGFYQRQEDYTWNDLVGMWADQTWNWNSRTVTANSPTTLLCSANPPAVFEYDYLTQDDAGAMPVVGVIETRDFVNPDGNFRTDCLEINMLGQDIDVEYSDDMGRSWYPWETVTSNVFTRHRMYKQVVGDTIRFRITCDSANFAVRWMALTWRPESDI